METNKEADQDNEVKVLRTKNIDMLKNMSTITEFVYEKKVIIWIGKVEQYSLDP